MAGIARRLAKLRRCCYRPRFPASTSRYRGVRRGGPERGQYMYLAKQTLIAEGRPVFLELGPVDPRSLMQGDYMRLAFGLPTPSKGIMAGPGAQRPRAIGKSTRAAGRNSTGSILAAPWQPGKSPSSLLHAGMGGPWSPTPGISAKATPAAGSAQSTANFASLPTVARYSSVCATANLRRYD